METEKQFTTDLQQSNLPFIEMFKKNDDLRNELFQQYLETERFSDVSLYWQSFYTSDELDKMIQEGKDSPLYTLQTEFHNLIGKNELSKKYYKHSIEQTAIIKTLREVSTDFEDFMDFVLREEKDKPKSYSDAFVKDIIRKLESIGNKQLTAEILNYFLSYNENKAIQIELILRNDLPKYADKKYRKLKKYANIVINEYLTTGTPEITTKPTLKSFFPNIDDKTVNDIQSEFKDLAIGKEMAILIYLLTKDKKILIIDENNKNSGSRLHFLKAFTGKELKRSGGISNFIEGTTGNLKVIENDPSFIKISQRLDKMV